MHGPCEGYNIILICLILSVKPCRRETSTETACTNRLLYSQVKEGIGACPLPRFSVALLNYSMETEESSLPITNSFIHYHKDLCLLTRYKTPFDAPWNDFDSRQISKLE